MELVSICKIRVIFMISEILLKICLKLVSQVTLTYQVRKFNSLTSIKNFATIILRNKLKLH